ncbi:MAG: response regulator [Candidatus Scalindua sp.]|nr:response regulator [Candidatus Scalindua sp.]
MHKTSEERIASKAHILEESLNEIYIFDVKTLRFIHVNKAARLNLGYSKEELRSHTALDLKPEFTSESFEKLIEPLVTGKKKKIQFTTVHRRKDDSLYDVEVHLQLSTFHLKPAFVAIILDTTELRRMEEELAKTQKLDCIGVFASGIAHDFKNGLQSILGYISLAKIRTKPNDEICEFLDEAGKAVLHTTSLAQQLLTFSKGGDPIKEIISVSELITDSTKLASSGSSARCELFIQECLWQIEADKGQLSQVLSNLILNAAQAMEDGGIIKIRAENINVVEKDLLPLQEGRYVRVTVEDHGIGILQENLQRIFDPYFTTKQEGSGLGLATAYSIVKKHDGHIAVESESGVGTTFNIFLSASEKEIPKQSVLRNTEEALFELAEEKDGEKPVICKGKILLMDDEDIIRTILSKQLKALKYEVEAVEEGSIAIRAYEHASTTGKPFDAVILDLTIPGGIGGKATIAKLLEIDPEVKAIVSSGYANDPVMANHMEYGFKSVLAKPHGICELDEALQKIIVQIN